MALYRDEEHVKKANPHDSFESVHKPGQIAPWSGVYRCINCGDESACNKGDPLPPQNHHQHKQTAPIAWRLLVVTQQVN
jgi:hypothetical protein